MMTDIQAMLMQQEGAGLTRDGNFYPYYDSLGKLTVGYGWNLEANGVPTEIANWLLSIGIANAIDSARRCFSCYDTLTRPRQLVILSMAYNLGYDGLNKFQRFISAVHQSDWEESAQQIENSRAYQQAPGRYKELARMMRENTSTWL